MPRLASRFPRGAPFEVVPAPWSSGRFGPVPPPSPLFALFPAAKVQFDVCRCAAARALQTAGPAYVHLRTFLRARFPDLSSPPSPASESPEAESRAIRSARKASLILQSAAVLLGPISELQRRVIPRRCTAIRDAKKIQKRATRITEHKKHLSPLEGVPRASHKALWRA